MMTREEAKFLLAGYRPNGADTTDARLAEALACARQDPELVAWFLGQQKFDLAVVAKLGAVIPPPTLRDEILVSLRLRPHRRSLRRRWAAVAVIMLGISVSLFWWLAASAGGAEEADLVMFATNYVANNIVLQKTSDDPAALRNFLATQHSPLPNEWPIKLNALRSLGCRTLNFKGQPISLICFGNGREFHLFVARRADFLPLNFATKPHLHSEAGGWSAAAWGDTDYIFVLVSDAPPTELKLYLAQPANRSV